MDKLEYIPGDLVMTNGVPYCYANEAFGIDYFSLKKVVE